MSLCPDHNSRKRQSQDLNLGLSPGLGRQQREHVSMRHLSKLTLLVLSVGIVCSTNPEGLSMEEYGGENLEKGDELSWNAKPGLEW